MRCTGCLPRGGSINSRLIPNHMRILPAFALGVLLIACTNGTEDPTTQQQGVAEAVPKQSPDAARDQMQRPQEVIALMGGDLSGYTIADLFAGDGYWTFKLIEAGANVIAVDNDPENIAKLEARKKALQLSDERLKIRAVPVGDPGLQPKEVDMALMVHHYPLIQDRKAYFERLRLCMHYPRPLFMVEWLYEESKNGPPLSQRMTIENIMDEIGLLGFADIGAHSAKIPGQVIFVATDYVEYNEDGTLIQPTQ